MEANIESYGQRYVIYARKSTEDEGKQVRSINDQISECQEMASRLGLHVIGEPIRETKSAKTPNQRPLFSQLLRDIKNKKIDGIIAWHPDRLARNMVEAGKIIHMLDTGLLKDMRLVSHQFSSDANGKMLLGMLFVFAKHYSDDLSRKVKRGIDHNLQEGKSAGINKHGYIRSDDGLYIPDEKTFSLIQQAWKDRAEGKTIDEIVAYLRDNQYSRYVKKEGKHIVQKVTKSNIAKMFNDTFYFGILNQANQSVDLRTVYNFVPITDENVFFQIQEMTHHKHRGGGKKLQAFLPLR